jgi:hypothetical protein
MSVPPWPPQFPAGSQQAPLSPPYGYPPPPLGYVYAPPPPPTKPRSIVIISSIAIGLGALAIVGIFSMLLNLGIAGRTSMPGYSDPTVRRFFIGSTLLSVVFGPMQIFGGILAIKGKNFGRKLLIAYGIIYFFVGTALSIYSGLVVMPKMTDSMLAQMQQQMKTTPNTPNLQPFFSGWMKIVGDVSTVLGILFIWVWCFLIVYFMTRPKVKAAFAKPAA